MTGGHLSHLLFVWQKIAVPSRVFTFLRNPQTHSLTNTCWDSRSCCIQWPRSLSFTLTPTAPVTVVILPFAKRHEASCQLDLKEQCHLPHLPVVTPLTTPRLPLPLFSSWIYPCSLFHMYIQRSAALISALKPKPVEYISHPSHQSALDRIRNRTPRSSHPSWPPTKMWSDHSCALHINTSCEHYKPLLG